MGNPNLYLYKTKLYLPGDSAKHFPNGKTQQGYFFRAFKAISKATLSYGSCENTEEHCAKTLTFVALCIPCGLCQPTLSPVMTLCFYQVPKGWGGLCRGEGEGQMECSCKLGNNAESIYFVPNSKNKKETEGLKTQFRISKVGPTLILSIATAPFPLILPRPIC